MKDVASFVQIIMHGLLVFSTCYFATIATIRLKHCNERLRVLELKTGCLRVQEGPGNRVAIKGALDALSIKMAKDGARLHVH